MTISRLLLGFLLLHTTFGRHVGVRLTPFIQTLHEDKGPAQFKLTREGEDDFAFDVTVSTNCPINNRLNAAKANEDFYPFEAKLTIHAKESAIHFNVSIVNDKQREGKSFKCGRRAAGREFFNVCIKQIHTDKVVLAGPYDAYVRIIDDDLEFNIINEVQVVGSDTQSLSMCICKAGKQEGPKTVAILQLIEHSIILLQNSTSNVSETFEEFESEKEYDILDGSRLVDFKPEQTKWCGRIDTHRFSPSAQTTLGTSGNKGFDLKGIEFHLLVVDGAEFEFTTKVKGHRKPVDSSIKELTISRAHMNVIRCSVSINEFKGRSTWMDEHDNRLSMALEDPVSAIRANGVAILRLRRNLSCEREGIFVCKYGPLQRQLNIKIRECTT